MCCVSSVTGLFKRFGKKLASNQKVPPSRWHNASFVYPIVASLVTAEHDRVAAAQPPQNGGLFELLVSARRLEFWAGVLHYVFNELPPVLQLPEIGQLPTSSADHARRPVALLAAQVNTVQELVDPRLLQRTAVGASADGRGMVGGAGAGGGKGAASAATPTTSTAVIPEPSVLPVRTPRYFTLREAAYECEQIKLAFVSMHAQLMAGTAIIGLVAELAVYPQLSQVDAGFATIGCGTFVQMVATSHRRIVTAKAASPST